MQGKVFDAETQNPIEFATVIDETNSYQTTTDADGNFHLKFSKSGTYTLLCKHILYQMQSKTIKLKDKEKIEIEFLMQSKTQDLEEIVVKSSLQPTKKVGDALFTGIQINKSGIDFMGVSNVNSVFNTLNLISSVNYQATDAYGLSERNIRIRGVKNLFNGVTVEGIPNYGIMPVGARDDIYDVENIQNIALYKGTAPVDLLAASGNRGGTIDINLKRPESNAGFDYHQFVGDNEYIRTFIRFDTGKITKSTTTFGSYSFTSANKWKGVGNLAKRNHFNFGLKHHFSDELKLEVFGNWNETKKHFFKPLNATQIQNLAINYLEDYNEKLTGNPSQDLNYYDYNLGSFSNHQYITALSYYKNEVKSFHLKAYLNQENSLYNQSLKNNTQYLVQNKKRDLDQWGAVVDYKSSVKFLDYVMGFWVESFDNIPYVYNNLITSTGLLPKGYAYYTKIDGRGLIINPFVKLASTYGKFKFQLGLKYLQFYEPKTERYLSANANELKPLPEPDLHSDAIRQNLFLPAAGIGFALSDAIEIYANYGKNYMRPYMYVPTVSVYLQNRAAFLNKGMNLQSIFNQWKMETSNNFDFGILGNYKRLKWNFSTFYSQLNNILANVLDPNVNVNYPQNVGQLSSYGFEIEFEWTPINQFILFTNPSYNSIYYNDNIMLKTPLGSTEIAIKKNQIPATPHWLIKTGLIANYNNLNFNSLIQYVGERYGDATHLEKVPAYWMWDASLNYKFSKKLVKTGLMMGLEVKNLLDSQYIGVIEVVDESQNGNASYYAGFSRTFVLQLKFDF